MTTPVSAHKQSEEGWADRETEEKSRRRNMDETLNFLTVWTMAWRPHWKNTLTKTLPFRFSFSHSKSDADPFTNKVGDLWSASKTKSCQSTSHIWTIGHSFLAQRKGIHISGFCGTSLTRCLPDHSSWFTGKGEDIFLCCLARSPALNAVCDGGSSCWWKKYAKPSFKCM